MSTGPFETEREACAAALAAAGPPRPGWSILNEAQRHNMLLDACADAGVAVGAYDSRILAWLTHWEDPTVAVIAGLITRAHRPELDQARAALLGTAVSLDEDQAATVIAALDDASEGIRERAAWCPACKAHPAALCDEDADRLSRAEAYDHLAAQLRKAITP